MLMYMAILKLKLLQATAFFYLKAGVVKLWCILLNASVMNVNQLRSAVLTRVLQLPVAKSQICCKAHAVAA